MYLMINSGCYMELQRLSRWWGLPLLSIWLSGSQYIARHMIWKRHKSTVYVIGPSCRKPTVSSWPLTDVVVIFKVWFSIAHRWMQLILTNEESTLVQVMAWCLVAPSHYLNQCWLLIIWANVDPAICQHMASLGDNDLRRHKLCREHVM